MFLASKFGNIFGKYGNFMNIWGNGNYPDYR